MRIRILRHGESESNARRLYAGTTDTPLSAAGIAQAENGLISPEISLVYVTPLRRTQQTARILFPNARQVVIDGLREMNFGIFEGMDYDEAERDPRFIAWNADGGMQPCPGGEGRIDFAQRVSAALQTLIKEARSRGEEALTIVAHGGTIMGLMAAHALPRQGYQAWWVDNLEGYELTLNDSWEKDLTFAAVTRLHYGESKQPRG